MASTRDSDSPLLRLEVGRGLQVAFYLLPGASAMTFDIRREREPIRYGVILKSNYIVVIKLANCNMKTYMDVMLRLFIVDKTWFEL